MDLDRERTKTTSVFAVNAKGQKYREVTYHGMTEEDYLNITYMHTCKPSEPLMIYYKGRVEYDSVEYWYK